MSYDIRVTNRFKKDAKKYKKKYRNISNDLDEVIEEIKTGELKGTVIPNIKMADNENNVIKVRVANSDIPCGEKGGYRLIYYAEKSNGTIYLLTVYCKRDKENISNKEIQKIIIDECI